MSSSETKKYLVMRKAIPLDYDEDNNTLLHWACAQGMGCHSVPDEAQTGGVEALAHDKKWLPLPVACHDGDAPLEVNDLLLFPEAFRMTTSYFCTPLHHA